ncbi:SelT-like protein [Echinococcus granulosus]|uniref:Selenoprotein t n=1 Tax=Echinococcus granulosus TaxID=6210 RepID=A0A068WV74_ECHGR|nr:SelT-like protein [Echinococcus granulosus]CDS24057.1 selenoprotein t [Echinococcus granulosus]
MERLAIYLLASAIVFGILTLRDMADVAETEDSKEPVKEFPELKDAQPVVPTLRFQYWAYEELAHIVVQRYPILNIEGTTYPPPQWRAFAAKIVTTLKFLFLALVIAGINPFPYFGLGTPNFMTYANENKVSVCLMCFFIGGLIEGQLLSTGAFEISFNDIPVWSKLQSNRLPQPQELLSIIDAHLQFQAPGSASPGMSFNSNSNPHMPRS